MPNDTKTDDHAGQGGSYRIDPDTGERVLIQRTGYTPPQPEPEAPQQGDDDHVATDA